MKKILLFAFFVLLATGCVQQGVSPATTTSSTAETTSSYTTISTTSTTGRATTSSSTLPAPPGFEIHEWGVLVGCTSNNLFFLTSRPEQTVMVKQPVIYVHSKEKRPFSVKATFSGGRPTDTYPPARIDGQSLYWDNVFFPQEGKTASKAIIGGYTYVPLENIMHTLNDVDSDLMEASGQKTRFLYYEGEMNYTNKVSVAYDLQDQEAYITNANDHPIYDVIFILSKEGVSLFSPEIYNARAPEIPANSRIKVALRTQETIQIEEDLLRQGFTESEASSFANLWRGTFLYESNTGGWGHLIYRIPQERYDKMIPLEISPKPDRIIRALYVLVHMDK